MTKKELKNAFEKKFENITVSEKLKEKTLNAVNQATQKQTSHIPYIKNIAAIFIVGILCYAIYGVNTTPYDTSINYDSEQVKQNDIPSTPEVANSRLLKATPSMNTIEIEENTTESLYGSPQTFSKNKALLQDFSTTNTLEKNNISTTLEKDFLDQHPNAEKIDGGYVIYENQKETIYTFKNGILENIIIID